jgi:phosphoglycolate phosphatase
MLMGATCKWASIYHTHFIDNAPRHFFMTQQFQAAIVDLDGTMIDTLGDFEVALNRMLADFGHVAVDRSFIERTVGKGSEHLIQSTLDFVLKRPVAQQNIAGAAIKNIVFDDAFTRYQAHYLAVNGQASQVYAGVVQGLQLLQSAGLKLACLTNKPTAFALPLLKAKGLDGYFSHVFGGDAFERKKPDPLPLLKTCEALGSLPARTLMVGDSQNDAQAAHAAGCPVVLVTYGYNHGQPIRGVPADGYVDSLVDITKVFVELLKTCPASRL